MTIMKKLLLLIALIVPFSSYAKELIQDFEWLEPNNAIEIVIGEPYQLHFSCSNNRLAFTSAYADSWVHIDFTGGQHVVDSPTGYSIDENGVITGMMAGSYAVHPTGWVQAKSGVNKWLYITVVSERAEIEPNNTLDTANDITSKIRFGLYNISDIDFFKYTNNKLKWGDEVTFKIHYYGSRENPFGYKWSTFCGTNMASGGSLINQDQECRALVTSGNTISLEVYYDQSRSEYFLYGEEFVVEVYINGIPASEYGDNSIVIDETNFPDANFRNYLLQQSYGSDGKITEEEIAEINRINVWRCNITSLKGIEYFVALQRLFCGNNQLTTLDVSNNTALVVLNCSNNLLTTLDLSNNNALTNLDCNDNQLTTLDISKNRALLTLHSYNNQLTTLDVSNNTELALLECYGNQLSTLDVSNNKALTSLDCHNNLLTSLDLSNNTALTDFLCYKNHIKDAGMDAMIETLPNRSDTNDSPLYVINNEGEGNIMTTMQVVSARERGWRPLYYNGMEWLDYDGSEPLGNVNSLISVRISSYGSGFNNGYYEWLDFFITNNSDAQLMIVSLKMYDYYNNSIIYYNPDVNTTYIDPNTSLMYTYNNNTGEHIIMNQAWVIEIHYYNMKTGGGMISKKVLKPANTIGTNMVLEDISENNQGNNNSITINETNFPDANFRNYLFQQNYGSDGMITEEEIAEITWIDVNERNISSLKGIEYFTGLQILFCESNLLSSLDVSNNTALTTLYCGNNKLTTLDVSKNIELSVLTCEGNQLISLDLSKNTILRTLYCHRNFIKDTYMDALIESLPIRYENNGYLGVIYNEGEGNVMTTNQATAAKEKGWRPLYYNGIEWLDYDGSEPDNIINGHQYVDLALPSGNLWSIMNYGANNETDYGDYVSWSENYIITSEWGDGWKIPTVTEITELINCCEWEWNVKNDISGYFIKGSNGNTMFLPAAGYKKYVEYFQDYISYGEGTELSYWSSTIYKTDAEYGDMVFLLQGNDSYYHTHGATVAFRNNNTVRPIYTNNDINKVETIKDYHGNSVIKKYYTINGLITNQPQKGLNIIQYSDGKTKKMVLK